MAEQEELEILEKYLPKAMSEAEMEVLAKTVISETGAESLQDMGRVMGALMKAAAGRADGKRLQEIVRGLLN
ncbi:GatB/YqeY domain-containing protein [bacterium]|nr:GatB/YqeY domain-containing protein [bacterium]